MLVYPHIIIHEQEEIPESSADRDKNRRPSERAKRGGGKGFQNRPILRDEGRVICLALGLPSAYQYRTIIIFSALPR
ncbi:hypothetical protein M413DRAFT_402862 [Hebeloma cylindrosporum]|uniref:Uncharacterized protein n=1 Tax=Hebeloma cylindrosporum TaxID=76867 RepID=A0A0C3C386_HEBCY|nr:hypothetical protein M413DRAFT_402862 [Hebeloma cylindrosporum h7]